MPVSDPFEECFPNERDAIETLRRKNVIFDELCSDFEDLIARIPPTARVHAPAIESLQDLEREIRDWLSNEMK